MALPDRSISLAALAQGKLVARRYRNRRIGEFLKELHLTEGRGTGIPTVLRVMRDNGAAMPRFETDEERSYFIAVLPVRSPSNGHGTSLESTQVSTQVSDLAKSLDVRSRSLLAFCRRPQYRASILSHLGLKSVKNLRQRYLQPLLQTGLLTMTDPEHPNSPEQKYQTTEPGIQALALNDATEYSKEP
jgi:ATP-dependent DNA helicase RecG